MRILLGQILTAKLQGHGIHANQYDLIAHAVYKSLQDIEKDLRLDDCFQLPNGTTLQVTYKVQ